MSSDIIYKKGILRTSSIVLLVKIKTKLSFVFEEGTLLLSFEENGPILKYLRIQ